MNTIGNNYFISAGLILVLFLGGICVADSLFNTGEINETRTSQLEQSTR